ncbi:hypothetical protein AB0C89_18180 [Streptomyces sp. NPDC048491]|uniref:hypothetical protein n=1 Tax=Streptomyces sp. NPDC048491 TaxID=3157207 RepID=UPI003449802E
MRTSRVLLQAARRHMLKITALPNVPRWTALTTLTALTALTAHAVLAAVTPALGRGCGAAYD